MTHLDHDRLANCSPEHVLQATYEAINALQDHPAHIQVAAAATLFVALIAALKADAQDVLTVTDNLLRNEKTGRLDQYRALRMYIEHELK